MHINYMQQSYFTYYSVCVNTATFISLGVIRHFYIVYILAVCSR